MRQIFITLFTFGLLLAPAGSGDAQIPGFGGGLDPLTVTVSPEFPGPFEGVNLRLQSFSADLNRSDVTWLLNGRVLVRGAGITEASFETGALGSVSTVDISVSASSGGTFSKRIVIRPTDIDLVFEAGTYVPPLYKGKALPSSDSSVTVLAIPHFITSSGSALNPQSLIYTWRKDGRVLGSLSGRGKSSLKTTGPKLFGASIIEVTAESTDGTLVGRERIGISAVQPFMALYEQDPLRGMRFERALGGTFALENEEVTILAEPFFFGTSERTSPALTYSWQLDGSTLENPGVDESSLTLRQVTAGEGEASLSLSVRNVAHILQGAQTALRIKFGMQNVSAPTL